ncbi:MAG: hypothetical protein ACI4PZ_07990 [Akkermansia sp.]
MARIPQSPFAARSLAQQQEEGSTLLFFLLPTLLVLAVFLLCALWNTEDDDLPIGSETTVNAAQ